MNNADSQNDNQQKQWKAPVLKELDILEDTQANLGGGADGSLDAFNAAS